MLFGVLYSVLSCVLSSVLSGVLYCVISGVFSDVLSGVLTSGLSEWFLEGSLSLCAEYAQSVLWVCWSMEAWIHKFAKAFLPIDIVKCSSNLNCVVLLFVAFVCLLRELHKLLWVAFCSDLEQLFWPYITGMSENLKTEMIVDMWWWFASIKTSKTAFKGTCPSIYMLKKLPITQPSSGLTWILAEGPRPSAGPTYTRAWRVLGQKSQDTLCTIYMLIKMFLVNFFLFCFDTNLLLLPIMTIIKVYWTR